MINFRKQHRQRGFTLVELLIVLFMIGLVMGSIYSLYRSSQRAATVETDVVDVQQNLRVALDSITRDIRHAGFLTAENANKWLSSRGVPLAPAGNGNTQRPINTASLTNAIAYSTLPATPNALQPAVLIPAMPAGATGPHAEVFATNAATPVTIIARLAQPVRWTAGAAQVFTLTTPEATDLFRVDAVNPDYVRIVDPVAARQPTSPRIGPDVAFQPDTGTVYRVVGINRANRQITLAYDGAAFGNNPTGITQSFDLPGTEYKRDCVMFRVENPIANPGPYPQQLNYCLGPAANCPPAGANAIPANACPPRTGNVATDPALCLIRTSNNNPAVVATGIIGLQFTYILDNGTEVAAGPTLPDLTPIRAVRVTLTGQTASAVAAGGAGQEKVRTLSSVIKLQNKF